VRGDILKEKAGNEGFGYDPIFKPEGYEQSFAQLSLKEKNEISHRGRATKALVDFLRRNEI
jgi:XTP/dITP diphosphohydrolase